MRIEPERWSPEASSPISIVTPRPSRMPATAYATLGLVWGTGLAANMVRARVGLLHLIGRANLDPDASAVIVTATARTVQERRQGAAPSSSCPRCTGWWQHQRRGFL